MVASLRLGVAKIRVRVRVSAVAGVMRVGLLLVVVADR